MDDVQCVFCSIAAESDRTIFSSELCTSFVSTPWFREGQCLVVPNRHVVTPSELNPAEAAAIMAEIGRLGELLDEGFGTGVMQKYQPLQPENGIKVNHLHFHVFPRKEHESGLFPVPEPNSFDGFTKPSDAEVSRVVGRLKP
jgi:histidine triad (HIT) family protein